MRSLKAEKIRVNVPQAERIESQLTKYQDTSSRELQIPINWRRPERKSIHKSFFKNDMLQPCRPSSRQLLCHNASMSPKYAKISDTLFSEKSFKPSSNKLETIVPKTNSDLKQLQLADEELSCSPCILPINTPIVIPLNKVKKI